MSRSKQKQINYLECNRDQNVSVARLLHERLKFYSKAKDWLDYPYDVNNSTFLIKLNRRKCEWISLTYSTTPLGIIFGRLKHNYFSLTIPDYRISFMVQDLKGWISECDKIIERK